MSENRSAFTRFLLGIWHVIDGARKLVLNLVFFVILYLVVMAFIDTGETLIIEQETALVLQPYGDVVEQYSGCLLYTSPSPRDHG